MSNTDNLRVSVRNVDRLLSFIEGVITVQPEIPDYIKDEIKERMQAVLEQLIETTEGGCNETPHS